MSPKKKRTPTSDDETTTTPKRLRTASLASPSKSNSHIATTRSLPKHLARIQAIQTSLQHALSMALATSAVSPSVDTGRVPNVLNLFSLSAAAGLTTKCDVDDIKRLCWLWEWDGQSLPPTSGSRDIFSNDDDNPFLDSPAPKDWTRGSMGLIITPTTYFLRAEGKRVPTYGIGIEVEMDLSTGKGGGMAAVARWTAEGDARRHGLEAKLHAWVQLHGAVESVPALPLADLPCLPSGTKPSSLTKILAKSTDTSPPKSRSTSVRGISKEFAVPFPVTPQTPSTSPDKSSFDSHSLHIPQTPSRQTGSNADTKPRTPTTSRRAALYERIRQKSLTSTPSSSANRLGHMSVEKMRILGQEEHKRRCLLGRLDEVAATVWALFSSPTQSSSTPLSVARKRRTMQTQEVVHALVASAKVPISASDAQDSLALLTKLCPFFLRPLVIAGEDWLEMPASHPASTTTPPSPRGRDESGEEVLRRSPQCVKMERGGLREVRERIRRELEMD